MKVVAVLVLLLSGLSVQAESPPLTLVYKGKVKAFYQFAPLSGQHPAYFETEEGNILNTRCMKAKRGRLSFRSGGGRKGPSYIPEVHEVVEVSGVSLEGRSCYFDGIARLKGELSPEGQRIASMAKKVKKESSVPLSKSVERAVPDAKSTYVPSRQHAAVHKEEFRLCMGGSNAVGHYENAPFCQCVADAIVEKMLAGEKGDKFWISKACNDSLISSQKGG